MTGAGLTVVAFSVSPVVPEVGVLLEVLPYTCSPHPCTLQEANLIRINVFLTHFSNSEPQLVLTSKSAANMSSDSVNMSGADGFFGLAPEHTSNDKTRQV